MDFRGKAMNVALALLCLNPMANAQNITLRMSNVTVKQAMDELKSKSGTLLCSRLRMSIHIKILPLNRITSRWVMLSAKS